MSLMSPRLLTVATPISLALLVVTGCKSDEPALVHLESDRGTVQKAEPNDSDPGKKPTTERDLQKAETTRSDAVEPRSTDTPAEAQRVPSKTPTASKAPDGRTVSESGFRSDLDPYIFTVLSGGKWKLKETYGHCRLIVRRLCSPEHCWSDTYLQWIESNDWDKNSDDIVFATVPIKEAGYGTIVTSARVGAKGPYVFSHGAYFDLDITPSHDDDDPRVLRIWPGRPGEYNAKKMPANRKKQ